MLVRPPIREYRTWVGDSRRWEHYRPRSGDVIVTTFPKCGTTWMQRIIHLLIFQSPEPRPVSKISPWYEMRLSPPPQVLNEALDAQDHRRSIKAHLPLDGLPIYNHVNYIHVARDGRDACLSFYNHFTGYTKQMLASLSKAGLDDPKIGKPYPPVPVDPASYFHFWLTMSHLDGHPDGYQFLSYFGFQKSYWDERKLPNLLMVHYNDLKVDLEGEMRRVAQFLNIHVEDALWPCLVEAASFQAMKDQGDKLMPQATSIFNDGTDRFFHKGQVGRWRDIFQVDDLALYEAKLESNTLLWMPLRLQGKSELLDM